MRHEVAETANPTASELLKSSMDLYMLNLTSALQTFGRQLYAEYRRGRKLAAVEFLRAIYDFRSSYKKYLQSKKLNAGSSAGFLLEWLLYHIIDEAIIARAYKTKCPKEVCNNAEVKFLKGKEKRKADISVRIKKPDVYLYCIEVKTNADDGWQRFIRDRDLLKNPDNSHRKFRYMFVALHQGCKLESQDKFDGKNFFVFSKNSFNDRAEIQKARRLLNYIYAPLRFQEGRGSEEVIATE